MKKKPTENKIRKKLIVISSIVLIIGLFVAGAIYIKSSKKSDVQSSNLYNENSITHGNKNAKVHVVKFLDPGCPACARFHFFLKKIVKKHPSDIRVTYRYAPFHSGSKYVATVLEASRMQGKHGELLEAVYKNQSLLWIGHTGKTNMDAIWTLIAKIEGLDQKQLIQDMKNPIISQIINKDIEDGKMLNVRQTPTFFVNGKQLTDFGYKQLEELINSEL